MCFLTTPAAASTSGLTPARAIRLGTAGMLAGIMAIGAGLRLALLGEHSLWFDEAWVVWMARHGWGELLALLRGTDAHPPLYYAVMKVWIGIAGTGEVALRAPSACFSIVSVGLTYALMRRVSSQAASLLSAFLVAASPFAVMAGQEARMYPLLTMLALASTLMLAASVERGGTLRWAAYAGLAALVAYTHYLGGLLLLGHGVWVSGWQPRQRGAWLAAMLAVAAAYAPWMPALRDQIVQVQRMYSAGWFRTQATMLDLGAVLGLLAFGGALLGMPGYLEGGTASVAQRVLLLWPFVIVLWCGVRGLARRPRDLAFVGLPPGVVLGISLVASVAGAGVFPRWFSFLVPFYAMVVAYGIIEIAGWFGARRGLAAALVTLGLTLYSVPVLARYYDEPQSRPYQWRLAAREVRQQAHADDAFIYLGWQPSIGLGYYLREPHPSIVVTPANPSSPLGDRVSLGFEAGTAGQLASRFPRAWLFVTIPMTPADPFVQRALFPELGRAFRLSRSRDFGGIWVYLFEARPLRAR